MDEPVDGTTAPDIGAADYSGTRADVAQPLADWRLVPRACRFCEAPISQAGRTQPKLFCSNSHRAAYRNR
jgi:hypothetical protein